MHTSAQPADGADGKWPTPQKTPPRPHSEAGGGVYGRTSAKQFKNLVLLYNKAPPLGEKRKLFWVGSSHALRLYQAALRNKDIKRRFENDAYVKPGATFSQLYIPLNKLKSLNEQDIAISSFSETIYLKNTSR